MTLVKYRTYELPADYSTADYAAGVLATSVQDATGYPAGWAKAAVVEELYRMKNDGADTFTVTRCFGPDDAEYGDVLGQAPRGCLLDVFYGDYRVLDVMRLHPAKLRPVVDAQPEAGREHLTRSGRWLSPVVGDRTGRLGCGHGRVGE